VYSRVTFSNRPYAEALSIGDNQELIMKQIMQIPNIADIWDSMEVENKILNLLS
jgi:kynurenine 3-monooxygenase